MHEDQAGSGWVEPAAAGGAEPAVERLARMQAATAALAVAATIREVGATITQQVAWALGAEGTMAVLVSEDGQHVEVIGAAGVPADHVARWSRFPLEAQVPLAVAVRTGQPQWPQSGADRVAEYPHLRHEYAPQVDSNWLSLPLLFEGRPIGGLSVRFTATRALDAEDRAYALTLAGLAAQALERARLFEAAQQARQRAEATAARVTSLQSITAALSRAMTPREVAAAVIEHALPGIGATAGVVGILHEDGAWIEAAASLGYPEQMSDTLRRTPIAASTPLAEAVRSGHPVWREAAPDAARQYPDYARAGGGRFPAGAGLPLMVDGRVLGGLGLSFDDARTFGPAEQQFMLAVAAQCAQALERTRLYEAEQRSRQTAERAAAQLDAILGSVADGIIAHAPDDRLVYANAAAAALSGFPSSAALLQAPRAELRERFEVLTTYGGPLDPTDLPHHRALRGDLVRDFLLRLRVRGTGEERWAMVSSVPVQDANGQVLLAISIFRDVTERQHALQRTRALAETGALLPTVLDVESALRGIASTLVETIADCCAVVLVGPEGAVQHTAVAHVDPRQAELFERYVRESATQSDEAPPVWGAVLRGGGPRLIPRIADALGAEAGAGDAQLRLLHQLAFSSAICVPLVARDHVLGVLMLLAVAGGGRELGPDDLLVAEETARRAGLAIDNLRLYEAAQDAVRARDQFLSIAAHELRTPITALMGTTQLLLRAHGRGQLDVPRLERHLTMIVTQAGRLATLTDDLLDVARLRTGRLELNLQVLDVRAYLADTLVRIADSVGDAHPLRLRRDGPTCQAAIDADRFEQVLGNVLGNAAKYSPGGGTIDVDVRSAEGGVLIEVTDHGIGLTPGTAEGIFEPFTRAPNAAERHIPGMGLGLHISREIVARHAGRMWATSAGEEQGTTVSIWLPCAPSPAGGGAS